MPDPESPIRVRYAHAMSSGAGRGGLSDESLGARAPAFRAALEDVMRGVRVGDTGFWALPSDTDTVGRIDAFASDIPAEITDVLVLGVGGSSLGARTAIHALGEPNEFLVPGQGKRRVHFADNPDPWHFGQLLERLAPDRTLVVSVSKSGGTLETAAMTLAAANWIDTYRRERMVRHFVAVTDPVDGPLRALAKTRGFPCFDIPKNVGGRFSVLTPAGLLPIALSGAPLRPLMRGAAALRTAAERPTLRENPAGLLSTLLHAHHLELGHAIQPLMPYADALRPFADWYVQLFAESLGKKHDRQGNLVEQGPTPVPAVGTTDQHAQMQLFIEGPRDKIMTFIALGESGRDLTIPHVEGEYAYLGGHSFFELLDAQRRASALSLAAAERPSITLEIPRVDAYHLGALFFLYEAVTAISGALYDVDAFDQPGVELGKRLANGLLSRPGFERDRAEALAAEADAGGQYVCG